jgi:3-deoxy-D-manno-octulosonic-acid transferase
LKILYNFGIYLLELAFWVGRFFSNKLKLGYLGRKNWQEELSGFRSVNTGKLIWIHCASLGEFEMARPLIEELKENYKDELSIVLTFFSPSGFELRKDYQLASRVFYLPFDTGTTPKNLWHF